jgi:hypothetical protein
MDGIRWPSGLVSKPVSEANFPNALLFAKRKMTTGHSAESPRRKSITSGRIAATGSCFSAA